MTILEKLFEQQDREYAAFQAKLTPTVEEDRFIGVRIPKARIMAKQIYKENSYTDFITTLPHEYYDENMIHALIISEIKDYESCIEEVNRFLPYVDNWAVCDSMIPKIFKKNKELLIEQIKQWIDSREVYTCRFGIKMLMTYFLDDDFKSDYLEWVSAIRSDEYYVNMMIAWYFATALCKQWDETYLYIKDRRLACWTHNKTIQKARESFRITDEQKEILKQLRYKENS